jgi:hypothetical protein
MSLHRLARLCAAPIMILGLAACAGTAVSPPAGDAAATTAPAGAESSPAAATDLPASGAAPAESGTQAAGTYTAALLAADAEARKITVALAPDGTAALSTEFVGKGTFVEKGTWTQDGLTVNVVFTEQDGQTLAAPETFVFELQGGNLANTAWDQAAYGEGGLGTLLKQP